ncbi:Uncharacterised protein [uncultured archaeon]|nr:Uncharacterised protein [uncultured archaeon]
MKSLFALGLLALLLFSFGCASGQKACTTEAGPCPDGPAVGRNASNSCQFDPCPAPPPPGTLRGKVTIGPLCPVEPCARNASELYSASHVYVYNAQTGEKAAQAPIGPDGEYSVELAPGGYLASAAGPGGALFGLPGRQGNSSAQIFSGKATLLDFDIDTGIR